MALSELKNVKKKHNRNHITDKSNRKLVFKVEIVEKIKRIIESTKREKRRRGRELERRGGRKRGDKGGGGRTEDGERIEEEEIRREKGIGEVGDRRKDVNRRE